MSLFAQHARFAPVVRLASRVRQRLNTGGITLWLLKAAVRRAAHKNSPIRTRHDPDTWRRMWGEGDVENWPSEPITGIIEFPGVKLVIDRSEITPGGHLWLDGWALEPKAVALQLQADHCSVEWQATFATSRPDVVEALQLSPAGSAGQIGFQILAHVTGYVPGRSRIALTAHSEAHGEAHSEAHGEASAPRLVVPVVAEMARSGSVWHAVYDSMRHRGPRDVAYLETSVRLLKELRKADWRERTATIRQAVDHEMPGRAALKVLLLSRLHPHMAYVNLNLVAAASPRPVDFVVCSMGQQAIQRANEYRAHFATIGAHTGGFVNAEITTPSSEVIEQFALSCHQRRCPGLIVYDDVAVAGAMASLGEALRQDPIGPIAWPRRFPPSGPTEPAFVEPLAANDGAGPYWRSAKGMEHNAIGALLFDPAGFEIPPIPPFEARGYALEYLLKSALADAALSGETMLDLVDPTSQHEAHGLDMLMLLASTGGPGR